VNVVAVVVAKMNETITIFFRRIDKFFHGMLFTLFISCVFFWACDSFYFGKSQQEIEEELMRSIFEVDSLMGNIKIILGDSSSVQK
tara:strand:+ start:67 stop:324 length:258 start_codon:yes stop_codon:yes gene_type:complete